MKRRIRSACVLFACLLAACSGGDTQLPPQYWQGIEFTVETRPSPAKLGINEILVVATRPQRQPVYDLIVSIRMREEDEWVQSIQDGHTGIFRRGLAMSEPGSQILWVRVERATEQSIFSFPLVISGAALGS